MRIPDKNDFQPSAQTLKKWLSTRKPTLDVAGAQFPGFLSDEGNTSDTNWFWIAFFGEMVGLFTTVYGGFRSGGIFLLLACLAILMFILLDYVFAVKLHRQEGLRCKWESEKILETDAAAIADIGFRLRRGRFLDFLLITGILVIAAVKIVGIVLLGVFNNIVLYIPFAVYYLIVAYVHIYHTGYYFAYRSTQKAIYRDHRHFASGETEYKAAEHRRPVQTASSLVMPAMHNPHEITNRESEAGTKAGTNGYSYTVKTKGVLTDSDVINLIDNQADSNRITLFKVCRKLQMETIEATENIR